MARFRSAVLRFLAGFALVVLLPAVTHSLWMAALGRALIRSEAPVQADIAVVLAGDGYGHRILKAAELARAGYVPRVLVSGPPGFYGTHECDLAIPFAVSHGYAPELFVPYAHEANSTEEEAHIVIAELRRRGVRRFLLVTSDYHTRRAGSIFGRLAAGLDFRVIAAPDEFFRAGDWWRSRPGRKIFATEWAKTITGPLGI